MISKSVEETNKIARDFANKLLSGIGRAENFATGAIGATGATIVALRGDLGSGKTTFAKAFAGALGIPRDAVTSPTFVIEKRFDIGGCEGEFSGATHLFKKFIHMDAYRLEKPEEVERLGWRETIADAGNLILIEWPENIGRALPKNVNRISFKFIDENTREIVFN